MTGATGAFDERETDRVVESAYPHNVDGVRIEEDLPSKDACPTLRVMPVLLMIGSMDPVIVEEGKDHRCEGNLEGIEPQWIVDADKKRLLREGDGGPPLAP